MVNQLVTDRDQEEVAFSEKSSIPRITVEFSTRAYRDTDYEDLKTVLVSTGLFEAGWDTYERYHAKIIKDPGSVLVATDGEAVIGTILIVDDGWAAFIFRVAIHAAYQGHGLGDLLMDAAEQELSRRGQSGVSIFVTSEAVKLQGFYQRRGFAAVSNYTEMYKHLVE